MHKKSIANGLHTTSYRRLIDVETTSCVYWVKDYLANVLTVGEDLLGAFRKLFDLRFCVSSD